MFLNYQQLLMEYRWSKFILFIFDFGDIEVYIICNWSQIQMRTIAIIIMYTLVIFVLSYKEFALSRSSNMSKQHNDQCTKYQKGANNFQQLCFEKDISYNTELYIDDNIYYVALDFTVPYSWLKSPQCVNKDMGQNKGCKIIENREKSESRKQFHHLNGRFRLFGRSSQNKSEQQATIYGSSQIIKGPLQKIQYAQIYAKDSKTMRQFFKILMMSLFLAPQKEMIIVQNANIVKAQTLSQNSNFLSDGAISMNYQQKDSFLSQFFDDQTQQRIITVFIHPQSRSGMLSVGEISLKNSKQRPSQIKWLPYNIGKTSFLSLTAKSITYSSVFPQQSQSLKQSQIQVPSDIYFTCSTSFIYLPKVHIKWLIKQIQRQTKGQCSIPARKQFLVCIWNNIELKKDALFYKLSFKIGQYSFHIPVTTLITISEDLFIQFAIKQSSYSDKIILGQPFMEQYLIYIDYNNHKIGFAETFFNNKEHTLALIYFLRFLMLSTFSLLTLYICFQPISDIVEKSKKILKKVKNKMNGRQSFQHIASNQFS